MKKIYFVGGLVVWFSVEVGPSSPADRFLYFRISLAPSHPHIYFVLFIFFFWSHFLRAAHSVDVWACTILKFRLPAILLAADDDSGCDRP